MCWHVVSTKGKSKVSSGRIPFDPKRYLVAVLHDVSRSHELPIRPTADDSTGLLSRVNAVREEPRGSVEDGIGRRLVVGRRWNGVKNSGAGVIACECNVCVRGHYPQKERSVPQLTRLERKNRQRVGATPTRDRYAECAHGIATTFGRDLDGLDDRPVDGIDSLLLVRRRRGVPGRCLREVRSACPRGAKSRYRHRSEEHTSELQSR